MFLDALRIMAQVAVKYDITADDLRGSGRSRRLCAARREAIYRMATETSLSRREIARALGLRGGVKVRQPKVIHTIISGEG